MSIKCPKCLFDNPDGTRFCGDCAAPLHPSGEIPARTETIEAPKEELTTGSTFAGRYQINILKRIKEAHYEKIIVSGFHF